MRLIPLIALAASLLLAAPSFAQQPSNCPPWETQFTAGQTIPAGVVRVSNSSTHLFIEIDTNDDWDLGVVHIYAGTVDLPLNPAGNPAPGSFPYQTVYNPKVDAHLEIIPLADLDVDCDEELYIAVHAEVCDVQGVGETAWAEGPKTWPGNRWGWYFCYTVCCDTNDCPNGEFDLQVPDMPIGTLVCFRAVGVPPGECVLFFASCGDLQCDQGSFLPPRFMGMRLDITRAQFLGKAPADATGIAELCLVVPSHRLYQGLLFQAAVDLGANSMKSVVAEGSTHP